eukprot:tig00021742_g23324.t1
MMVVRSQLQRQGEPPSLETVHICSTLLASASWHGSHEPPPPFIHEESMSETLSEAGIPSQDPAVAQRLAEPSPLLSLGKLLGFAGETPRNVLWTPDGRRLIFSCASTVVVMDVSPREEAVRAPRGGGGGCGPQQFLAGHTAPIAAMALQPRGELLATIQEGKHPLARPLPPRVPPRPPAQPPAGARVEPRDDVKRGAVQSARFEQHSAARPQRPGAPDTLLLNRFGLINLLRVAFAEAAEASGEGPASKEFGKNGSYGGGVQELAEELFAEMEAAGAPLSEGAVAFEAFGSLALRTEKLRPLFRAAYRLGEREMAFAQPPAWYSWRGTADFWEECRRGGPASAPDAPAPAPPSERGAASPPGPPDPGPEPNLEGCGPGPGTATDAEAGEAPAGVPDEEGAGAGAGAAVPAIAVEGVPGEPDREAVQAGAEAGEALP